MSVLLIQFHKCSLKAKTERDEAEKTKVELGKKMKPIELEIAKLKASMKTLEVTLKQHVRYFTLMYFLVICISVLLISTAINSCYL